MLWPLSHLSRAHRFCFYTGSQQPDACTPFSPGGYSSASSSTSSAITSPSAPQQLPGIYPHPPHHTFPITRAYSTSSLEGIYANLVSPTSPTTGSLAQPKAGFVSTLGSPITIAKPAPRISPTILVPQADLPSPLAEAAGATRTSDLDTIGISGLPGTSMSVLRLADGLLDARLPVGGEREKMLKGADLSIGDRSGSATPTLS